MQSAGRNRCAASGQTAPAWTDRCRDRRQHGCRRSGGQPAVQDHVDFGNPDFRRRVHGTGARGAGDVIVARTPDDDPVTNQTASRTVIRVRHRGMPRHGLTLSAGAPDLTLNYYLL